MTTLATVYERQREARTAREQRTADAERLTAEVAALREEVGGRVFRVVDSKLAGLAERIGKLNRKAAKLGTGEITLTVSDEHDQTIRKIALTDGPIDIGLLGEAGEGITWRKEIIDYTFVTVDGETPMIDGWVFVATLDHDADQGADESVGIRRAPVGTGLAERIGEDAAKAVENIDLTDYRQAGPDCDHCGFNRRRKQTYVLYEVATGELRQIGSTCLADYTGAHNPERVAAWAEWLEALYTALDYESGEDGFGDIGAGGGRMAIPTIEYLAHVSAVTREFGWTARWARTDYGFERNEYATADQARSNLLDRKPRAEVTDADYETARTTLDWVRDDLGERDDLDEFQHNLVTYCRGDYLPEKGDGFIASAIGAHAREIERELERERAGESEWIGQPGERIKGLTFTVTFTRTIEGYYGTSVLTKGHTPDGDLILWFGKGGLEQGTTYMANATIKAHERDSYAADAKITKLTRVMSAKEVALAA